MSADPAPGPVSGLSRQSSVYRRMMAVCDKLAAAAVQGADAVELTRIFAQTAGKPVILLDPGLRPQAQASSGSNPRDSDPGSASLAKLLPAQPRTEPLRRGTVPGSALAGGCLATPVSIQRYHPGLPARTGQERPRPARTTSTPASSASYTATLFAPRVRPTQAAWSSASATGAPFVDSLVSGRFLESTDARRKARRTLHVTDAQPFRVTVARLSAPATSPPVEPEDRIEPGTPFSPRRLP